jgi:hypothetical protein
LFGKVFSIQSVQSGYKEQFSWESAVEFRSSKWSVSRELRICMEGWEDGAMSSVGIRAVKRRFYVCCVIQWSCVKIRCQKTVGGDCNRLRTLVCVTVNCKLWKQRQCYRCL